MVLYFYPRDDTPGCTRQSLPHFRDRKTELKERVGAKVFGVSTDDVASHEKFTRQVRIELSVAG